MTTPSGLFTNRANRGILDNREAADAHTLEVLPTGPRPPAQAADSDTSTSLALGDRQPPPRALSGLRTTHAAPSHSPATRALAAMRGSLFTSMMLSAQDARLKSCTRAAACLPTGYSPCAAPISPSDSLIPMPPLHSRFDLAPRAGVQLSPAVRWDVSRRLRRIASNSK